MALGDYDHVRDLSDGRVAVEGVDLNFLRVPSLEVFARFTHRQEFDVGEMSFGRYISLASHGDADIVALPVFVSRMFRIGSVYINPKGAVAKPEDLRGKRIGLPEWAQTATIYMRGWLRHYVGVDLNAIRWVVAGVNAPHAFEEQVQLTLPGELRIERVSDRCLSDMLVAGEIDAIFSAGPPRHFMRGDPRIVQLFPNHVVEEERYFAETGIFPIMHIVAMRRELAERHPWLPMNLLQAFEQAKQNSLTRMRVPGISTYAIPWHHIYVERSQQLFGRDFWPYGVSGNRKTLEAFAQYAHEQGVAQRHMPIDEFFVESARELTNFYSAIRPPQLTL